MLTIATHFPAGRLSLIIHLSCLLPILLIIGERSSGLLLNNQPDELIIRILFYYKTLHVSGIFCAHNQKFSTVH